MNTEDVLSKSPKEFKSLINTVFGDKQTCSVPSIALAKIMDTLLDGTEWCKWEYETIESDLSHAGLRIIDNRTLPQIQAIQAVRGTTSLYDHEWHCFEKCVLALSRIPVVFFWKQEPGLHTIQYALSVMRAVGSPEFSDEVKYYIGAEFVANEIIWYPIEFIDECIQLVLHTASDTLHLSEETVGLRVTVHERFKKLQETDLDKIELDFEDPIDVMIGRILHAVMLGKSAMEDDLAVLRLVNGSLKGESTDTGRMTRIFNDENEVGEDSPDIQSSQIHEVVDMSNIAESEMDKMMDDDHAEHLMNYVNVVDGLESHTAVKVAVAQGSDKHILTGVPMRGCMNDLGGPMKDLEETTWSAVNEQAEKAQLDAGVITNDNRSRTPTVKVAPNKPTELGGNQVDLSNLFPGNE